MTRWEWLWNFIGRLVTDAAFDVWCLAFDRRLQRRKR